MVNGPFRFRGGFEALGGGVGAPGVNGAGPEDGRLVGNSRIPATDPWISSVLPLVGRIGRAAREASQGAEVATEGVWLPGTGGVEGGR